MSETVPTRRDPYEETFDDGPGGWMPWGWGVSGVPEIRDGVFYTRSPWWVDPNHAPPGAGYLHLLAYMHTHAKFREFETVAAGPHRFTEGGFSRDFTNARMTVRMRGDVDLKGTRCLLLVQADLPTTRANFVLSSQPFALEKEWRETTVTLTPRVGDWICLGSRLDRFEMYGWGDIAVALKDVNCDIILVLFPVNVVPTTPVDDQYRLYPHRDFEPDPAYLPSGEVQIDTIRIEYPR